MKNKYLNLFLVFTASLFNAQTNFLDTSFNGTGMFFLDTVFNAPNNSTELIYDILEQPDNKAVYLGKSYSSSGFFEPIHCTVFRLNSDGTLDSSFGAAGVFRYSTDSENHNLFLTASKMVLLQDGSILIAGYGRDSTGLSADIILMKITKSGILDTSFGQNGIAKFSIGGSSNKSVSNLLVYGEKIYIAGRIDADSYIISSNMDGTYNTDFNNDGRYILDVGGKTNTIDQLLIVNNIIYAFGSSQASSTSVYTTCVSALNIDGSIAAFGIDGSSEFLNTSSNPTVLKVIPKENGKMLLIVGGDFYMINRYGNPDTTFGNQGKIVNPYNQSFTSCAVASDNGFYFSKFKYLQTTTQMVFYTVKINAEFGKSTNFGSGGEITTNVSYPKYSEQMPSKLLSSADGKLVVAGSVTRYPNPNVPSIKNQDYVVLRYGDPSVLSANNDNSKSEISIYPNPAKNIISIRSKDKILKIVLFDATGKLLKSFTGPETKQINVANMTTGNYILKIYTKDKVTTQKIIKE